MLRTGLDHSEEALLSPPHTPSCIYSRETPQPHSDAWSNPTASLSATPAELGRSTKLLSNQLHAAPQSRMGCPPAQLTR